MSEHLNTLPPHLREALTRELDPGEDVRWCGQPDPRRESLRVLPHFILLGLVLLGFGAMLGVVAVSLARQLHGLEPLLAPNQAPSWSSVWFAGVFAALLLLIAIVSLIVGPRRQASAARRTIYALTPTRIVTVRLSRGGMPYVEAIEPCHPLHIRRFELGSGMGDVLIYPVSGQSGSGSLANAGLSLYGITDAREVERLIRVTFDPPGASGGSRGQDGRSS